ncbi:hypothetical protein HYX08_02175 [Candidatus Woesearchaeota archaeon]|nr:hypothetical protein [Candidatus Woesearchaeota archaeon]
MGRIQVVLKDETETEFRNFLAREGSMKKGEISQEIERLITGAISTEKIGDIGFIKQDSSLEINDITKDQIKEFYDKIELLEKKFGQTLILLIDKRIDALYTECHISSKDLIGNMDLDPSIDQEYQEEFRANRNFEEDNPDYLVMVEDAKNGRQFSDIVIEYNSSEKYSKSFRPLKVYGGQHRCHAIEEAYKDNVNRYHGTRVYFNLDKDQRGNIAIVSNTNIQVSNDLRDRLNEQSLDPPNKLRDFCYKMGLLDESKKQDFSSKKHSKEALPTVRAMRTFVVNFHLGKEDQRKFDEKPIVPPLCETGGSDDKYLKIYKKKNFVEESDLVDAGLNFVKLCNKQKEKADGKSKNMALTLAIVASWSYAAGLLQKDKTRLKKLYSLPDATIKEPLNSNALSNARGKDDLKNYRGLITRYGEKERGRLLQIFLTYSKSAKNEISLEMCNYAIKLYHSKKENQELEDLANRVY